MDWIQSINKAIEYIEEHLTEDIHSEDVANYVHISMFHFQRAFTLFTNISVSEYIRKRRLSKAGEELTKVDAKVIDVALKYGYETPESFAKAFTRFHGITPSQSKKGNDLKLFNKLVIKISVEGGTMIDYRIEQKECFRLLVYGRMFTDESSQKGIPEFWDEYYKQEIYKKAPGYLGICAQEKNNTKEFMYGIGCDADDVKEISDGFQIIQIPNYTNYELIPDYDLENYLPGDNTADDYVSEIWIPIKARK